MCFSSAHMRRFASSLPGSTFPNPMSYQKSPQEPYPPPGYGTHYPPPGYPTAPPPAPYEGYPPPAPTPGWGYPPPPHSQRPPPYEGYQGYFSEGYPKPPPPPQYQVYHCEHVDYHRDDCFGCFSFLRGCLTALCCCCLLEECCF